MLIIRGKKYYQKKDCTLKDDGSGFLCPECKDHKQGNPMEVFDCKNLIYDDELDSKGRLQGRIWQCCCWSKEHGKR